MVSSLCVTSWQTGGEDNGSIIQGAVMAMLSLASEGARFVTGTLAVTSWCAEHGLQLLARFGSHMN